MELGSAPNPVPATACDVVGLGSSTCWLRLLQVVVCLFGDTSLPKTAQIWHRFEERMHSGNCFSGGSDECHVEAHMAMLKSM